MTAYNMLMKSNAGWTVDCFPSYSRSERLVDNCVHILGVGAGILGVTVLLITVLPQSDNFRLTLGTTAYGFSLLTMLGCSALYNVTRPSPHKALFRRFDHAAAS